jgi:hypothetical protein
LNGKPQDRIQPGPVVVPPHRNPVSTQETKDARPRERSAGRAASRLIAAVAGSSSRLGRIAAHPIGASLCLALGYMALCGVYIYFSGRAAGDVPWSGQPLRHLGLLKAAAFVLVTGAAYFWFASRLLKRIAIQQQHLDLIFQGVSDCLFLLKASTPPF